MFGLSRKEKECNDLVRRSEASDNYWATVRRAASEISIEFGEHRLIYRQILNGRENTCTEVYKNGVHVQTIHDYAV